MNIAYGFYYLQVSDAVKKQQYEFDSLVLTVSLPAQLSVREVSPAAIDYLFFY